MRTVSWLAIGWLAGIVLLTPVARSQPRPYIGYVYPAGGQQGKTFQIRLGGQNMDDVSRVQVTGAGVTTRIVEYWFRQNNQEQALLNEQLQILKKKTQPPAPANPAQGSKPAAPAVAPPPVPVDPAVAELMDRLGQRTGEFVQTPACASLAALLFIEVTIAAMRNRKAQDMERAYLEALSIKLPPTINQIELGNLQNGLR